MAVEQFASELDALLQAARQAFSQVQDAATLESARIEFLGARSGRLKNVQKELAQVPPEERPAAGRRFNEVKAQIEQFFREAQSRVLRGEDKVGGPSTPQLDPTLPGVALRLGRLHPITQTMEELKEIMGRLGFAVADGPEVEDEWHNFEALNIPTDHPARDPLDNFYLAVAGRLPVKPILLRSQTSTVQIRVMEKTPPPVRIIALGRVYRPDEVDATHYPMFHQMEGLLVDRGVTMAHLKSTLRMFASAYLGRDARIRFRPSFFPFTEPSVEVDFQWGSGWIEFGGAGMVDPAVLTAVGYDPDEVTGFAFGLGVERLCMRRHQITDIRELYKNDVRFLRQF
jgi:phenylalanyl-tRNA synthetase alpha chain